MDNVKLKNKLVEELIVRLNNRLNEIGKRFENAREAMIESPGRNQARYDSSREEFGNEAALLQKQMDEIKNEIEILKNLSFSGNKKVEIGAIFKLSGKDDFYFLLSVAGGEILEKCFENKNVFVITDKSPMGKILKDRGVGDIISINGKEKVLEKVF